MARGRPTYVCISHELSWPQKGVMDILHHHNLRKGSQTFHRRLPHPWVITASGIDHRRFTDVRTSSIYRHHLIKVSWMASKRVTHFRFLLFEIPSAVNFFQPLHHPAGGLRNTTNISQSEKALHLHPKSLRNMVKMVKMVTHMCCTNLQGMAQYRPLIKNSKWRPLYMEMTCFTTLSCGCAKPSTYGGQTGESHLERIQLYPRMGW